MKNLSIVCLVLAALTLPSTAFAFCGFYVSGGDAKLFNDATQVVLMRHDKHTVLSMQNNYEGPAADFAMVVPVPQVLQKENVKTLDKAIFDKIDKLSAPRLVEYWEQDPCFEPAIAEAEADGVVYKTAAAAPSGLEEAVKVEAQFKVAEYDIVVLSATEATALDKWLRQNKYNIPDGAEPLFKPYIESGVYFFVAKVDAKKVKYENGKAVLSPLRFNYESDTFSLPIRLGMVNSKGQQDLIAYVLGANNQRYELANYGNVTIPTNLEVSNGVRERFGGFYQALFSRTLEENPKSVVTEYSWTASGCDPCPGPALQPEDIQTLGADAIPGAPGWGWNLTRLHARYGKDDIGEDLIFKEAGAIVGGREVHGADGLEKESKPSPGSNNFQGRYIIRHEWKGEVKCDNPQRGIWGGPGGHGAPKTAAAPSANTGGAAPEAAKDAKIDLTQLVRENVPAIKLVSKAVAAEKPAADSPAPKADGKPEAAPPKGCSVVDDDGTNGWTLLGILGLVGLLRRRRR